MRPIISCSFCGKEFRRKPYLVKRAKKSYCSATCRQEAEAGEWFDCFICGDKVYRQKHFIVRSMSGKFFCGKKCSLKWQNSQHVGDKHPNWTTGEFSYRRRFLKSKNKKVCRLCGFNDDRMLIVHHLDRDRKNNKEINLVWLCCNCHHLVHHYKKEEKNLLSKTNKNG